MGTIAIGTFEIGSILIGAIGANLVPKLFGGGAKTSAIDHSALASKVTALKAAIAANADKEATDVLVTAKKMVAMAETLLAA